MDVLLSAKISHLLLPVEISRLTIIGVLLEMFEDVLNQAESLKSNSTGQRPVR